jgi:hypothetical protein
LPQDGVRAEFGEDRRDGILEFVADRPVVCLLAAVAGGVEREDLVAGAGEDCEIKLST